MSKALESAIAGLTAKYGEQVVYKGSETPPVRRIMLGIPALDYVMGGGLPINKFIEFIGPKSAGKSYATYKAIAAFQHYDWGNDEPWAFTDFEVSSKVIKGKGATPSTSVTGIKKPILRDDYKPKNKPIPKRAVLIDYENSYDKTWGEILGINNETLLRIVPDRGSAAADMIEALLAEEDICIIGIDSIGAIAPDAEVDASMEDYQMGAAARFWNKAMRKFQAAFNRNPDQDVTLIGINRKYSKIGMVFGDPEVEAGGSGIKFAKHVSVEFRPQKIIKGKVSGAGEIAIGRNVILKNLKNKTARPHLESTFYFSFVEDDEEGIEAGGTNILGQLISLGIESGVITRKGAWHLYDGIKSQGREAFIEDLNNAKKADSLMKEIYLEAFGA